MVLPLVHEKPGEATLNAHVSQSSSILGRQEGGMTSYSNVLFSCNIHKLRIIVKAIVDIRSFKRYSSQSIDVYAYDVWTEALRWRPVNGEYHLKGNIYSSTNTVGPGKRLKLLS